jgi:hypothetical protein
MPAHLEDKHPGAEIPREFEDAYSIGGDERIHLRLVKGTPTVPPKKQGAKRKGGLEATGEASTKRARK